MAPPRFDPGISAPTVIIAGDLDSNTPLNTHAKPLSEAIPDAKLIVLAGVGHATHHAAADLISMEISRIAARNAIEASL